MTVSSAFTSSTRKLPSKGLYDQWSILGLDVGPSSRGKHYPRVVSDKNIFRPQIEYWHHGHPRLPSQLPFWNSPKLTRIQAKIRFGNTLQDPMFVPSTPRRNMPHRPSALPQFPDISDLSIPHDPNTEYAILVSMYEVYNDRIFDLLSHPRNLKEIRRRPLLFKPTESSPDRKLVAGLRKILCESYEEAMMVLETGLMERRVAGTGSNSVSSRSHGFFCIEVKRRPKGGISISWRGSQLTIVDLAGEEMVAKDNGKGVVANECYQRRI